MGARPRTRFAQILLRPADDPRRGVGLKKPRICRRIELLYLGRRRNAQMGKRARVAPEAHEAGAVAEFHVFDDENRIFFVVHINPHRRAFHLQYQDRGEWWEKPRLTRRPGPRAPRSLSPGRWVDELLSFTFLQSDSLPLRPIKSRLLLKCNQPASGRERGVRRLDGRVFI